MTSKDQKHLLRVSLAILMTQLSGCVGTSLFEAQKPIYLTDVEDGRIFQRDENGLYDLEIGGGTNGFHGAVEARVVMDGTSEEVVPWRVIDRDSSDGVFSGSIKNVPQGGWFNIQVRAENDGSSVVSGKSKFGVGALVLTAGQSHIDLWFESFQLVPDDWDSYGEVSSNPHDPNVST